ncbi:MAG: tRNA pseudouridine(38-40) synthase TruA [Anaerolineae bacterium]|nr:tRNA pseudouridine(38-40) synthase TruA [Anaerolineae bacterium]
MTPPQRYRATVEYDGTDFLGYQIQTTGRTVQGEIEKSLQKIAGAAVRIDGAGRTDAGVHATGQVIAFNVAWKHALIDLQQALNANLPRDIVITDLKTVNIDFHPRFSAVSRSYQYTVLNRPWPSALERRHVYHVKEPVAVAAMNDASRCLLGSHNFASFGKPPQGEVTIREVMQAGWSQHGDRLVFMITANAFLYRMVRTIVGTLLEVGRGRLAVEEVGQILEARDLTRSAAPAPAHGLCLVRVTYPEDAQAEIAC